MTDLAGDILVPAADTAERHTTGRGLVSPAPGADDATAPPPPAGDLPALPLGADGERLDPADARALSHDLFRRLAELEEGTEEYSYVRNTLVELNLNLVHYAASRMRSREDSYEDVVQVGTIGLIKAINRFDPTRGVEFTTFAVPTVLGEIKRFFRDTTWAVRVPRRLQELRLDLNRAAAALEQTHGRSPTAAELAEHLDLDEETVAEGLTAANAYSAGSLDLPFDGDEAGDTLAEHLGRVDPGLATVDYVQSLKPLIARLPERERRILALRFVEDKTQREIGEEFGISQMHVSRLLTRILSRLRGELLGTTG
ncbi:RNA polymerase sigma factor SigF [Streptomyces sp. JJ36]|uniref:RNA polymerase sigma factor SigF n=1 Tax=Streptomyces sp. JJ36 TaxID=2736645 RepID=UPI001F380D25|nr:RNA polymerase sigma factor SigF [Streptomyces sp. JJ36]MCF6524297.1 RNA polymerase sigma factor SigF [Streptomyces sp. JJ36]